jgi:hypothetical protein
MERLTLPMRPETAVLLSAIASVRGQPRYAIVDAAIREYEAALKPNERARLGRAKAFFRERATWNAKGEPSEEA